MKRAVFSALLVCFLGLACGSNNHDPGNQPASMAGSGAGPSAGSSGAPGQAGGQSGGGKANDNGGSVNGGAAGIANDAAASHAGTSSGGQGSGNAGAGGQTQWPDWVDACLITQAERCGGAREELVCIYGTDQELALTMVSCNDTVRDYKDYCKCNVGGCGRSCRPEYQ